jgi:hypothetical protein
MPIELQSAGDPELVDPGQDVYDALLTIVEVATEPQILGLLAALKRGDPWEKLSPVHRELCASLEDELFEEG